MVSRLAVVILLSSAACGERDEVPAPAISRQPLVDRWVTPLSTLAKGTTPQRPVFDGTQFWVTHSVPFGDLGDTRDVLRRYDAQGLASDTGPVRLAVRGGKLIRVNGTLLSLSISAMADGGAALFAQPINAQGLTGAAVLTQALPPGTTVNTPLNWYAAWSPSDARVLVRTLSTTETITELGVAADGTASSATAWPTTTTHLVDLHFDGTRYLATVSEADGGMAMMGLSGPSNEARFYRPFTGDGSQFAALGGDATLGAVMTNSTVQLTADAQLLGAPIAFVNPAAAYRDGNRLMVVSNRLSFMKSMSGYYVDLDGGISTGVALDPPYAGPITFFTPSATISPIALSGSTALIGWTRQQEGTGAFVNAVALGTPTLSTARPMFAGPALISGLGTVDTASSPPVVIYAQETDHDDSCTEYLERLSPTGGLDTPPIVVGDCLNSFDQLAVNPLVVAGTSTEWLVIASSPFSIYSKLVSPSGLVGATHVITSVSSLYDPVSVAAGGGLYLVVASKVFSSGVGYFVNGDDGSAAGGELLLLSGVSGAVAVAYDGARFHVMAGGSAGTSWAQVVSGSPQPQQVLSAAPAGLYTLASGTGFALAAWTNGLAGNRTVTVAHLSAAPTPQILASWDAGVITSLAAIESEVGTHVAAGTANGLQWVDVWPDGGQRMTQLFAGSAVAGATLQRTDAGVVIVRSPTAPATQLHVDWLRFLAEGAACADDLDCLGFRCVTGVCCSTCTVVVIDAGVPDAGGFDAGALADGGSALADAGVPMVDAGLDDAGVGVTDAGAVADAGTADGGVTGAKTLAVGCDCDSTATGAMVWSTLLVALIRRRSKG